MQLLRGVTPLCRPVPDGLAAFTRDMDAWLLAEGGLAPGDACIIVGGEPLGQARVTNRLAIHFAGRDGSGFTGG
jgi:pyruvate kinase